MLLRPATPLTVLLLTAFVLLLLSVLSTPVVKSIPIATVDDIKFGIFGYCVGSNCSPIRVGYTSNGLFNDASRDEDFSLPSSVRHSLSSLLIVHPVAAFLTLTCFGLAAAAHFHSPSHSPRYLLGLLILLLPTLLVSLLAFLVDILLFVPHLEWGGWVVLAATILITASGVLTCAMRRTLVSRKARKKRIAENAEMSGENFYSRQNAIKLDPPPIITEQTEASLPNMTSPDSLPAFARFESHSRSIDDDKLLLNDGTPSSTSPDGGNTIRLPGDRRSPGPYESRPYNSPVDEYGNPLPPGTTGFGPPQMRGTHSDPRLRNQYSNSSMGSQRGRGYGYGPPRGRGGYLMRGRGGPYYGPRGPPPHGYGMRGRGGPMGPGMMGRGRGPPPGYPPEVLDEYRAYGAASPLPGGYGDTGSRSDYGYDGARGPLEVGPGYISAEMQPGLGAGPVANHGQDPHNPMDNSVVRDYTGLHPEQINLPDPSPPSVHNEEAEYIPPRAAWEQALREPSLPVIERQSPSPHGQAPIPHSTSRGDYYEDVEPRFAEPNDLPPALTPGALGELQPSSSLEDIPEGAHSPAASETSHFTSISQRGVNPKWRSPEAEVRHDKQRRQDLLLGSNPDFELPVGRGRGGGSGRKRKPTAPVMPSIPATQPLLNSGRNDGGGRYPAPTPPP
ncbi:pH-response regulator protein palI/rim-9 [Histoplasma capsulatum]|uniref:pH-response regulator protein palI/rim-9 n=1 Tax=Ajellomyces capsulatus TaxID=5037 RepID=A0A8A1M1N7_AJECA|nr:predicted protein [Histoplasma mississippiense (nom. inval.)]EDN09304.1 predicted protein [Histoplasma mississippiense (nom. inval.)]QSS59901.1 pH-response regulator protein palI/rim-9 [Histoplasma capsulatum]